MASELIISADELQSATGCTSRHAAQLIAPINISINRFQIDTRRRLAAFLAQCGHETMSFRYLREIWGPTPAQERYEGRLDLGNTEPGDGRRFLGRGLIHLTGRDNYRWMSGILGVDFVASPEALESPLYAALSAGAFWDARGLNRYVDAGAFELLTRRINGGVNGYADRVARFERALDVLAG